MTYGAEHASLRSPTTLTALAALEQAGIIEATVHDDLDHAYRFLRMVEHRLQIVQQRQTHTLDASPDALELSARRMGFDSRAVLEATLSAHQDRVHAVYADLLTPSEEETDDGRRLFRLLAGELSDDEAVELLDRYGFADTAQILHLIRTLDQVPSLVQTRSTTRNLLANLLAVMLAEVAAAAEPSRVVNRLERIVTRSGAPGSLYRTLLDTPPLRTQLVTLLDTGDLFTDRLSRYPEVFDFLVAAAPDVETHRTAWDHELDEIGARDPATRADRVRRLRHIEEVKVLVEWLDGGDLATLQEKLSGLADACVARIMTWLRRGDRTRRRPDRVGGGGAGQARRGRADRALGPRSRLRLPRGAGQRRALLPMRGAWSRSSTGSSRRRRRRASPITSTPVSGRRARPGALALPVDKFEEYLADRAERWERLAWTRYRVVAGSPALSEEMNRLVTGFVYGDPDPTLPAYARHIRSRMETELGKERDGDRFDLKVGRGGSGRHRLSPAAAADPPRSARVRNGVSPGRGDCSPHHPRAPSSTPMTGRGCATRTCSCARSKPASGSSPTRAPRCSRPTPRSSRCWVYAWSYPPRPGTRCASATRRSPETCDGSSKRGSRVWKGEEAQVREARAERVGTPSGASRLIIGGRHPLTSACSSANGSPHRTTIWPALNCRSPSIASWAPASRWVVPSSSTKAPVPKPGRSLAIAGCATAARDHPSTENSASSRATGGRRRLIGASVPLQSR